METFWYAAVTGMLAIYVVLDGIDFGVGMLHLPLAGTDRERRTVLGSIGPVWTGYEVWLIGSGGVLFFAFPRAYAAGFSGFYLALILVLWFLIGRGLAVELRNHLAHPLWRQFWDWVFAVTSGALAFVFGAALGNLIRGVPLTPQGYFFVALWTDFLPWPKPGILDWYTLLMGCTTMAILALHGANYLAMKTEGDVALRADRAARRLGWVVAGLTCISLLALPVVQPTLRTNFDAHPQGYLLVVTGLAALVGTMVFRRRRNDVAAFAASSLFIFTMLGSAAWGIFPNLLIATDPANNLTIFNSHSGAYGLETGLVWFTVALTLMAGYQIYVHLAFRGKVRLDLEQH